MTEEMEVSTGEVEYGESEKIVAHILIDPNSTAEMDISTHNSVVTTIAQSIIEQNPTLQLDAHAYSILEQTIAETMAGNTQNIAIDTGSSLVPMEITIGHPTEEDLNATSIEVPVSSNSPEKNFEVPVTSSQSFFSQEASGSLNFTPSIEIPKSKLYVCEICDRDFSLSVELEKHIDKVHSNERMRFFCCAYCDKSFKLHKNFIRHMSKIHGVKCEDPKSKSNKHDEDTIMNSSVCKSKDCIRRKTNVKNQGHQTGCDCVPPKNRCIFCKTEKLIPPRVDDSDCLCFEPYFAEPKTFSEAGTGTGCGNVNCTECPLCPKFENYNPNITGGTGIQCIECNITFTRVAQLRSHLKLIHGHKVDYQILKLPDITAFHKWKYELERREMSCFTKQHGNKKLKSGLTHFYACHRSGRNYSTKGQEKVIKMSDRKGGAFKLGIQCTASLYVIETPNSGVIVKYWPEHYGHGKDTSFVQISPEEHAAIQDSVNKGVSVDTFLDDIRDHQAEYDNSHLYLLKKKETKFITRAFASCEFNNGLSDAESTDLWIRSLCQIEDSPVLLYKQELDNEEFLLVIMTEFQKQILLAADKEVICIDALDRKRGNRFHFTVMSVIDECGIGFPVAFCISSRIKREVAQQFYLCIRDSTGPLECTFLMTDQQAFYYETWVEIMGGNPRWLWCLWYLQKEIKLHLQSFQTPRRVDVYNILKVLIDCQNETIFHTIYEKFIRELPADQLSRSLGAFVEKYYQKAKFWAQCYRRELKPSVSIHLELLHYAFQYCCRERCKRRLDKFLLVVMKLVRRKMLDRLSKVLDEENINIALSSINMYHHLGLDIPTESVTSLSNKIWVLQTEDEGDVYVSCDLDSCPENCKLKCDRCDVCVHTYSCTCSCSLIQANLCQHIHAVAWKFLVPHFTPPPSPGAEPFEETESSPNKQPLKGGELVDQVMARAHDVYKKVRDQKHNLNKGVLTSILGKLNSCIDMCDGKSVPDTITFYNELPVFLLE